MSAQDTLLRTTLALMLADPTSALTDAQRQWASERLKSLASLSSRERDRLRPHLLAWCQAQQPHVVGIVKAQFS